MTCPLLELCRCDTTLICPFCVQLTLAVFTILLGTFLIVKPRKVIDLQIAVYRPFNWKIEPISMEKEIRNTRIMGMAAVACGSIGLIAIFILQKP
jgi:hypothetical protein